jgi:hypothetical protein
MRLDGRPWKCWECGEEHEDYPRMSSLECHFISNYHCPRCGALKGDLCIDVRIHRARKIQDPIYRQKEWRRSAIRPRWRPRRDIMYTLERSINGIY